MKELTVDKEFIEEYGAMISKYIWSKDLEGRREYDDIYHEVIIKLMESIDKYDPKRAAVTTWITWVMRTVVNHYFRSKQVDALYNSLPLVSDQIVNSRHSQDPASEEDVVSIINKSDLNQNERDVMLDFHYYGYTLEELSRKYKENVRTIQTRLNRARIKLTAQVQGEL